MGAVGGGFDQVAVIAARTGYHDHAAVGRGCAFAVQPAGLAADFGLLQEVVVYIEQTLSAAVPLRQHSFGNQYAVGAGKVEGGLVFRQIICRIGAAFGQAVMAEPFDMAAQYFLPQTARTAVYQQLQAVGLETCGQQAGVVDGIDCLQFGKVVAAADGA